MRPMNCIELKEQQLEHDKDIIYKERKRIAKLLNKLVHQNGYILDNLYDCSRDKVIDQSDVEGFVEFLRKKI
jgi:hypothetical protein